MVQYILEGILELEKELGDIKLGIIYGELIDDRFMGMLILGILDIGNIIIYWDNNKNEWVDG